ncbi:MAG: rhodanese-like domain-containing protein [Bacteroidia bacterium]
MFNFLKNIINPERPDLGELLERGAIVIDVRTPAEFKGGHPKGAINIPVNEIGSKINKIKSKNKPVITCCASGARSGAAASKLSAAGIEVVNGGPWQNVAAALR